MHQQIHDQGKLIAKLMQIISELSKRRKNELIKIKHKIMGNFTPTRCTNKNVKKTYEITSKKKAISVQTKFIN